MGVRFSGYQIKEDVQMLSVRINQYPFHNSSN